MKIFLDNVDFRKFRSILSDVVDEFELECWDFCVMQNHYHLCVCPRRWNFSEAIQKLNGDYGRWWNARHARVGHVFQGRFKDQIVQAAGYLKTLCGYIARNPGRAKLVEDVAAWKWSSCAALGGLAPVPAFLSPEHILSEFGDTRAAQQAAYLRYVRSASVSADNADDRFRSKEGILGDVAFKRTVRRSVEMRVDGEERERQEGQAAERLIVLA